MRTTARMNRFDTRTVCATTLAVGLAAAAFAANGQEAAATSAHSQIGLTTDLPAQPAVLKQATLPVSVPPDFADTTRKLFFGYVEFDHDPNAPGGVYGFGPLPSANERAIESVGAVMETCVFAGLVAGQFLAVVAVHAAPWESDSDKSHDTAATRKVFSNVTSSQSEMRQLAILRRARWPR